MPSGIETTPNDYTTPIRVLHIFAPCYKTRFTGPVIQWKYYFNQWQDHQIAHFVLDTQSSELVNGRDAFNFTYSGEQKTSSFRERFVWIFKLFKNLRKFRTQYDLLHVHVLWWGGLLIGPWAKRRNVPTVYESVLLGADTPSGIEREALGKVKLWCLRSYKSIMAVSEFLAEDYLRNGFSARQVFAHMNSIDTDLFRPARSNREKTEIRKMYQIPQESKVLLFVGSVIERKGIDILIRAFIETLMAHSDLYLVVVGAKNRNENPSIDENFVNSQFDLLEKCGLVRRTAFLGLVQERDQLAEIYRAADCFIFPSRNEGMPTVLLEAMASGLPVVISRLPVLEHVINDGHNGLFFPVADVNALQQTITDLLNDEKFLLRLGKNARAYAKIKHSFKIWQQEMSQFYQRLMVDHQ